MKETITGEELMCFVNAPADKAAASGTEEASSEEAPAESQET